MLKCRPDKIKHLSESVKLDELHKKQCDEFLARKNKLLELKELHNRLTLEYNNISSEQYEEPVFYTKRKAQLKSEIDKITEDIFDIENDESELDYYSKTNDILLDYYTDDSTFNDSDILEFDSETEQITNNEEENSNDEFISGNSLGSEKLRQLQLKSQKKMKPKKATRRRMRKGDVIETTNILDYLSKSDNTTNNNNNEEPKKEIEITITNKATLLNNYMKVINNISVDRDKKDKLKLCSECGIEKTVLQSEGLCVCTKCGEAESIVIESEIPSHNDTVVEKVHYPYKRANHLSEWLNQFQAKESTDIPEEVMNSIKNELKKKRITNKNKITIKMVKNILKKLKISEYYEHTVYIVSKLTGQQPPSLSRETEEKIKYMFKQIQEPFMRHCPQSRINFLSYSFVLRKIFRILGLDEYIQYFELLKSKEKLRAQEIIWEKICLDLGWPFYSDIDI